MAADTNREKVERADAVVRETQEQIIRDPTVFVKGAALGALTLQALAQRAAGRTTNAQLLGFADRVRRTQAAILKELTAIAARKRLDVPSELIFQDEQMLHEADGRTGADFDVWFTDKLVSEHFRSVDLYEAALRMTDAQLAAFAKKTLPLIEEDRKAAMALPKV